MDKLPNTIFDFITQEETNYKMPIPVADNYDWSMKEHIYKTVMYKNSQYTQGNDNNRPFKNIIRPILNLQYRAEGFDVKDIDIYVDDHRNFYKSFLVKKFHDRWAREQGMDTFIDELVESYVDFGGVLVKQIDNARPEVVPLQSVAFCDQTDILSGPLSIRHYFSPDQLEEMGKVGWGEESNGATHSIEDAIDLAEQHKNVGQMGKEQANIPGKYIEIYEVHGNLPTRYLKDEMDDGDENYASQIQIVAIYNDEKGNHRGVTLFRKEEKESPFKLLLRDEVYGRALGFGGAEELFQPQIWINYDQIRVKGMLDAAAKILYKTTDPTFAKRQKIKDLDNEEILDIADGTDIEVMDTTPRNIGLFEKNVMEWEEHAQQMGAAQNPIMGEEPKSGTPFRLQALVTQEAHSLHKYRQGKLSVFVEEIYRDWILPHIAREILKGDEFMIALDYDEMQEVSDRVARNEAHNILKERVLQGKAILPGEKEDLEEEIKMNFIKNGNKKFISILEKEFKSLPFDVKISIAGKQKNLAFMAEKLSNVWAAIVQSEGRILQNKGMAKLFNQIIESSGVDMMFNPADFAPQPNELMQPAVQPAVQPVKQPVAQQL